MDDPDITMEDASSFMEQKDPNYSPQTQTQGKNSPTMIKFVPPKTNPNPQTSSKEEKKPTLPKSNPYPLPPWNKSKSPLPSRESGPHSIQPLSSPYSDDDIPSSSTSSNEASPSSLHPATLTDEVDVQVARAKERVKRFQPKDQAHAYYLCSTLHAFLEYLPDAVGRACLASDILSTTDDEGLYAVFERVKSCLLVPMIIPRTKEEYTWEERDLQETCFRRDDNACVVCGLMDSVKWSDLGEPIDREIVDTEVAYLIPESYSVYEDKDPAFLASAWSTLWRYFPGTVDIIDTRTVKDPVNAFTLDELLQDQFVTYQLAFKATDKKHVYRIITYPFTSPRGREFKNNIVELSSAYGSEDVPLPNPELFKVHHAMCEIVYAIGADDFIGRYIRRMERTRTLRNDGSSNLRDYILRFGVVPD